MGFMRKAAIVSTGGLARVAINPNSKKARTAKATEEMLKLQRAQAKGQKPFKAKHLVPEVGPDHVCDLCGKTGHHRASHVPGAVLPDTHLDRPEAGDALSPPPAVSPAGASELDLVTQISKLSELHAQGVLSDAEFAAAKARLLS